MRASGLEEHLRHVQAARASSQANIDTKRNNTMNLRTSHMERPASQSEQTPVSTAYTFQRLSLAACIILAPLSITLYLLSWEGNGREPLIASAMAGPTGNILHLIGAVAASFFLPLGYLGMSLLGMRRAPWLATISAALSLVGWIPWAAWAFALTSPLTMLLFPVHNLVFQEVLIYLICALWISSTIPAAFAMLKNTELAQPAGK
jgi:hypothetical protein